LHGLCANPLEMRPVGKILQKNGYSVCSPLIKGCGIDSNSLNPSWKPSTWEDWLGQVGAYYEALKKNHDRVAVVGLCLGAVLGLALAEQQPVDALALISPTLFFDGWNISRWRRLLPLVYLPGLRKRVRLTERPPYGIKNERLRQGLARLMQRDGLSAVGAAHLPAESVYQAERLIRRVKRDLPLVHAPTLILHATEDDVAGPKSPLLIEKRLGRRPELHWFENSYHMLTLDNERELVCRTVQEFVQRELPPARRVTALAA